MSYHVIHIIKSKWHCLSTLVKHNTLIISPMGVYLVHLQKTPNFLAIQYYYSFFLLKLTNVARSSEGGFTGIVDTIEGTGLLYISCLL